MRKLRQYNGWSEIFLNDVIKGTAVFNLKNNTEETNVVKPLKEIKIKKKNEKGSDRGKKRNKRVREEINLLKSLNK